MDIKITTLSENTANYGLLAEWGLSILVEVNGARILVDTGLSFSAVHNAQLIGIDLSTIDCIVLSHGHADHTGGLREVLKIKGEVEVIAHPDIWTAKYDMKLHSSSVYVGAELKKMGHERGRFEIMIFLPVLVLGGELYTWLNGNVDEVNEVLLEGRCHTKRYFDNMLIGVAKGSYFKEFLSKIDEDNTELLRQIWSNRCKLDEQVKMILDSPSFNGHPLMRGRL